MVIVFVLFTLYFGACKKTHPIGSGYNVVCICTKDTTTETYQLGNKYAPIVDTSKINPVYIDSCNALEKLNGFDSCNVQVIFL